MGNPNGSFEYKVSLIAKKGAQIRHNALEAIRISVNRRLEDNLGRDYRMQVVPYPHHVLRENKMIFGAHADRLQDGMRGAFGKPIGSAARVKVNQAVVRVNVNKNGLDIAKEALKKGKHKLPTPCRIEIEKKRE
jgi:large subunit ribosomal protein L10e